MNSKSCFDKNFNNGMVLNTVWSALGRVWKMMFVTSLNAHFSII